MKVGNLVQDKTNMDVGIVVEKGIGTMFGPTIRILWASSGRVHEEEADHKYLEVLNRKTV